MLVMRRKINLEDKNERMLQDLMDYEDEYEDGENPEELEAEEGWEADLDDEDWNLPELKDCEDEEADLDDEGWDLPELDDDEEADSDNEDWLSPETDEEDGEGLNLSELDDDWALPDDPDLLEPDYGKGGTWKSVPKELKLSDDEERDELMEALKERLRKSTEREKSPEELDRMWRECFRRYFPMEMDVVGPENDPEFPSGDDFPGDFPEFLQLELNWKSRCRGALETEEDWEDIRGRRAVRCPECAAWTRRVNNYYTRKFLDLRVRGYGRTKLFVRVPQFQCGNPECGKIFSAPMPPLFAEGKRMTARLQEFIWLLNDRVNAEKAAEILTAMGMLSEDGGQVIGGDRVLQIRKMYKGDEELEELAVGGGYGRYKGRKSVETCAEELLEGLSREREALMTVWREEKNEFGETERIPCERTVRLEAMARILDEVFDD